MISVRNHLPPLSGNKWLLFSWVMLITGACSPKLQPVAIPVKIKTEKPVIKPEPPPAKPLPPKPADISLLLPFSLDHLNPGQAYSDAGLKQAMIALDYYQGFKLALDSLTMQGYNYKLQVFDTRGTVTQAHSLAYNPQIRASDLIVGPVFPDDLKAFTNVLPGARKPIVSPLSPAAPSTVNNQNLVTVIPPLEYHTEAAAKYISRRVKPQKIFILRSGFSEENDYLTPFIKAIDSLSKGRTKIIQLTVSRGNLKALIPQLSTTSANIFVIASTNQLFLMATLRALDSMSKTYPVILFGHPSWVKFNFLRADLLQRLRTHITSADKIDYKAAGTNNFLRQYRSTYHVEPGEYAVKGFDEGLYFGKLLGEGHGELKNLEQSDFEGLHNNFHFIKLPGLGWVNTHVSMFEYRYYELSKVE